MGQTRVVAAAVAARLLLLALTTTAVEYNTEDDVIILNADNFDSALKELTPLFVKLYAPWCNFCKTLAPEYQQLAIKLRNEDSPIRVAKVDGTENKALMDKYNATSFPTLLLFLNANEQPLVYSKDALRKSTAMLRWLKKRTGPATVQVSTDDEIDKILVDNELVVFGLFKRGSEAADAFQRVAESNDDYVFLIPGTCRAFKRYQMSVESVMIIRHFDERRVDMSEPITVDSLTRFLDTHRLPLMTEFNKESFMSIKSDSVKTILMLMGRGSSPDMKAHIETVKDVMMIFRGKVRGTYVDIDTDDTAMSYLGVQNDELPAVRYLDILNNKAKYRPLVGHQLTTSKIAQFVQSAIDGRLKPYLKSQPLPADWDSKPVKTLVKSNFHQVAKDPSKHVFVKFYAPWCHYCKNLAPIWEELAEKFKDNNDVTIAEVDATENEFEDISINGFPTLMLFPKATDQSVTMDLTHEPTVDELVTFVQLEGKVPADVPESADEKVKSEL